MGILDEIERQRRMIDAQAQARSAQDNLYTANANLQTAQNNTNKGFDLGKTLSGIGEGLVSGVKGLWNAVAGGVNEIGGAIQNTAWSNATKDTMAKDSARRNEIAKKYGYNSYADALNDENASQDFWDEVKGAVQDTKKSLNENRDAIINSATYNNLKDMRQNKYGADAIRGLNFLGDVMTAGAGGAGAVAFNAAQGGLGGLADQLEQADGLVFDPLGNNYNAGGLDAGEVAKSALTGTVGGTIGSVVGNSLGNAAAKGNLGKIVGSNVGRGAITGAASSAAAAGTQTALNGGDLAQVLSSAASAGGKGALAGGVTSAGMGLVNKGFNKLSDKINKETTPNVKNIADDVNTKANKVADTDIGLENQDKSNIIGRSLKKTGETMETAQANVTRAERSKLGIKNTGEVVDNVRKRTGMSSVQDQADFAKNITGAGDQSVMDTIQKHNISYDENGKPIKIGVDKYEVAVNEAVKDKWRKSTMGKSYDQFRDDLISDIKSSDPITASNRLKADARKFRASALSNPENAVKAEIYTDVANKLDDLSYSVVPQKNVKRMFTDTIDEFRTRAAEAKAQGNTKYAKAYTNLANELENTPQTIKAYRSFKKDFVDASNIAEISAGARSGSLEAGIGRTSVKNKLATTFLAEPTDRALAYAGGKLSDLGDFINGKATKGKFTGAINGALSGAADKFANSAINTDNLANSQAGNMVGALTSGIQKGAIRQNAINEAENAAQNMAAQEALNSANAEYQAAQTDYANAMAQAQQAYTAAQQSSQGQQIMDRIGNAMMTALNAGDLTAYSQLATLYSQAYKMYGAELEATQGTTQQAEKLTDNQTKALNGLQQLNQLANMAPDAGTALASGPLAGIVNMFGGNEYASQAQSLALTLGYLQSGANVSKSEAENIGKSYIPTAFDSEQVRQQKLERARALLNNYLYGTQYYQG